MHYLESGSFAGDRTPARPVCLEDGGNQMKTNKKEVP